MLLPNAAHVVVSPQPALRYNLLHGFFKNVQILLIYLFYILKIYMF